MIQQSSSVIGSFSKAGSQSPSEPLHMSYLRTAAGDKVFAYYVHISFLPWAEEEDDDDGWILTR